jgi:chlorite dismutase
MSRQTPSTFNHFNLIRFTPVYWALNIEERRRVVHTWLDRLRGGVDALHTYQTFGVEAESDLLTWGAIVANGPEVPQRFFTMLARATAPVRSYLTVARTLWGFTRPSQYTKVRSTQELDPFATDRLPYLIMYPFVKTAEWYLKVRDERKEMMAQHIKVGKQYKDITQLLLYSFGLQDQEFVVVYETADLTRFLKLVEDLRATKARVYTERDTPLHLGIHQRDTETLAAWL